MGGFEPLFRHFIPEDCLYRPDCVTVSSYTRLSCQLSRISEIDKIYESCYQCVANAFHYQNMANLTLTVSEILVKQHQCEPISAPISFKTLDSFLTEARQIVCEQ